MRFKHFIYNEADPMGGMGAPPMGGAGPLGAGPAPGGAPGMMPPGGGMDPMGGGGMGGPGGAPGGMGGDPMGGMGGMGGGAPMGAAPQIPVKMKDADVWDVLEKLLGDNPQGGNQPGGMVQPDGGYLMR